MKRTLFASICVGALRKSVESKAERQNAYHEAKATKKNVVATLPGRVCGIAERVFSPKPVDDSALAFCQLPVDSLRKLEVSAIDLKERVVLDFVAVERMTFGAAAVLVPKAWPHFDNASRHLIQRGARKPESARDPKQRRSKRS